MSVNFQSVPVLVECRYIWSAKRYLILKKHREKISGDLSAT